MCPGADRRSETDAECQRDGRGDAAFAAQIDDVGADHADRALGEVHDARTAVDEHEPLPGQRVDAARPETENGEADDVHVLTMRRFVRSRRSPAGLAREGVFELAGYRHLLASFDPEG